MFQFESLILLSSLVILSLLIGVLLVSTREKIRIFILATLTFSLLDVALGGWDQLSSLISISDFPQANVRRGLRAIVLISLFAIVFLLLWKIRNHAPQILLVAFTAFFISNMITQIDASSIVSSPGPHSGDAAENDGARSAPTNKPRQLPSVVVIVLDEMIAPEGIPKDIAGGDAVLREIIRLHEDFGFRLYGRAYSRHYYSAASIPNMLNFNYVSGPAYNDDSSPPPVRKNKFFDYLSKSGYQVNVYQTSHINFCDHQSVTICETLNARNPISPYVHYPGKPYAKLIELVKAVSVLGLKGSLLSHYSETLIVQMGRFVPRYEPQAFVRWFDEIAAQIVRAPGDSAIFVHVILPHAPHILSEKCEITDRPFVDPYDLAEEHGSYALAEKARRDHYRNYFQQIHCVYSRLRVLLEKMNMSGLLDDATVIIVGDHGSRISMTHHSESMSRRDYIDNYATLFSIRAPGVKPGYDRRSTSIQQLFAEYVAPERDEPASENGRRSVVVHTSKNIPAESEMPMFGEGSYKHPWIDSRMDSAKLRN